MGLFEYQLSSAAMNNKLCRLLSVVATIVALVTVAAWYQGSTALEASRARFVQGLLEPAAALVEQNQALLKELRAAPPAEKDSGVLETYLAQIRRDGVAKHAQTRQRLDQFATNNVAITTLLTAYMPHARTPALQREVDKFREHTASWQRRWGTVMEIFMAGGTYATAEIPFPSDLPGLLQAELAATR